MSHKSRSRQQRNTHTHDETQEQSFFSKQHDIENAGKKNSFFQPKLSVNEPGDVYEKEADAVANTVVNQTSQAPAVQQKKISSVQRLSTSMEDEKFATNDARMEKDKEIQEMPIQKEGNMEKEKKKNIQKKDMSMEKEKRKEVQKTDMPMEEDKKKKPRSVQRKSDVPTTASGKISSTLESSAGHGKPLPANTLHEMNTSFGVDFSNVRVHKDGEAANMNKELQAQAFTHGSDIYFNQGKYDPESSHGKFLLAHELTHVVQQGSVELLSSDTVQRQQPSNLPTVPGLGPEKTKQVSDMINNNDRQGAINVITFFAGGTVGKNYNVNSDLLENSEMKYDPNHTSDDGATKMPSWDYINNKADPAKVVIGPSAFSSIPYLYSVIMHEYQHVLWNQSLTNQKRANDVHQQGGVDTSEIEAYSWEIMHASESGLDKLPDKIAKVWSSLNSDFWKMDAQDQTTMRPLATKALNEARRLVAGKVPLDPFQP